MNFTVLLFDKFQQADALLENFIVLKENASGALCIKKSLRLLRYSGHIQ